MDQQQWLEAYHQRIVGVAEERGKAIQALTEAGLSDDSAARLLDGAVEQEAWAKVRPLGIEGKSEIQKTDRAWAALDTVVALFTTDWSRVGDERPEPIEVSLGLIDHDEAVQIRVAGTDPERVTNYAARMKAGDDFPPVVLFFERGEGDDWHLWLADGFHRYEALLRTMDYTAEATVYAGTRRDAEEYAATCNARHGLPMSNEDKRAAARRLLEIHPEWSNREIARRLGVSHPFVGKMRRQMEDTSGNDYQMPEERVVTRGDQTYTYTPPEHETERESPYLKVWEIERGIRSYLDRVFASTTMDFSANDDDSVAQEQRQHLIKLRREGRYEELHEHISGSFREGDVVQAVNNVIEQLRQEIERHRDRQRSQAEPAPDTPRSATKPSTSPDEPPRLAEVIRNRLIEGDVEGFVEALRQDRLDGISKPKTPSGLYNALNVIFRHSETYGIDPWDRDRAVRCLYDAIVGAGKEDSAPEKAQATDAAACPECGGRVIHISANGKPARDVCMECGTVIEIKEETV
jgi:hypothetical protein